jgi:acylphosphatase
MDDELYRGPVQCRICHVNGRVQGVYYRSSTQKQAQSLGVRGSARNLPDGRVEVIMCGDDDALESLIVWLWQGPQFAEVNDVTCSSIDLAAIPEGFDVR